MIRDQIASGNRIDTDSVPFADARLKAFSDLLDATDAGVFDEGVQALRRLRALGFSVVLLPRKGGGR